MRSLTPREEEIAALVADGVPPKQIVARLRISRATYQKHIAIIAVKLDLPDHTTPAVGIARWWGRHRDAA